MVFAKSFIIIAVSIALSSFGLLGCGSFSTKQNPPESGKDAYLLLRKQKEAFSYFSTGYFFLLERSWEIAADNFEKASEIDPSSERILKHLATCYFQLGENEKAIGSLEKLAKQIPQEFNIHYTLATLYESVGKKKEAIFEYEYARKCNITQLDYVFLADALYRLANIYMDEGVIEKGAECYQTMFKMHLIAQPAKFHYEIGIKYFEKNIVDRALEHFLSAKKYDPKLNFTSFYITLCYDILKDYDNAVEEAKGFLLKEPDNWAMRLTLSEIYEKLERESERDEEVEKIKKILENNVDAGSKNPREYFLLSQIYRSQHKINEAINTIENMRLLPLEEEAEMEAHFLLANLYYESQNYGKVEEELRLALKINPDFHEANNFLGYFFAENNRNIDEAIVLIKRALNSQPTNGAYLDSLGWAYYKKAQIEERDDYLVMALQKLEEAVKILEEPDIFEHIGDVAYSLGSWCDALDVWEKAKALYEKIPSCEKQLGNVTKKIEKLKRLISMEKNSTKIIAGHREKKI
ncbi:MAG: tetratricopeptide repeat protein [Planctomycetes bacterium]|nr:tetratricopeptide repeat protein [Planctomycetota bacterium]